LTDNPNGERSLTSPCGNVTVTLTPDSVPKVGLAKSAASLFPRDLADLVAATAREAADAARAEAQPPQAPSIGDAVQELTAFRDSLRDDGFEAALAQRRSQLDPDAEPDAPQGERPRRGPKLALPPEAMAGLETALELLRRHQAQPPGTGKGAEAELPTGRGRSEGRLATVEAMFAYPIAAVVLSRHACELGTGALESQINEAAAAAAADLARQRDGYLATLGAPIGGEEAATLADRGERLGADGVELVEAARLQHERLARMFNEGGHFA
jgi:hypothetical protein